MLLFEVLIALQSLDGLYTIVPVYCNKCLLHDDINLRTQGISKYNNFPCSQLSDFE